MAEWAQLNVRGLAYLEQGRRRPFRYTVRRLARAVALAEHSLAPYRELRDKWE